MGLTEPEPKKAGTEPSRPSLRGMDIGIHLMVCVLVAGGGGYCADRWFGSQPWLMMLGGVLGFGAWLVAVWRMMRK